nr:hypothetical protein [Tanacetum cinerariifolium]
DEESLDEEDASKQGRISDIDANQDIYLVNVHRDEDIFGNIKMILQCLMLIRIYKVKKLLLKHKLLVKMLMLLMLLAFSVAATTPKISMDEITLAKALIEIKTSRPKAMGIVMQEPKPEMPLKKKAQISHDEELAFKLLAEEYEQERIVREKAQQIEEARLFMEFLEKRKNFFAAKRAKEKRTKPPTKAQQRSLMSTYLKNMNGLKTRALKNKSFTEIKDLFDKAMKRINNFVDFRNELVEESTKKAQAEIAQESSSKRARDKLEQEIAKKQRIENENESA